MYIFLATVSLVFLLQLTLLVFLPRGTVDGKEDMPVFPNPCVLLLVLLTSNYRLILLLSPIHNLIGLSKLYYLFWGEEEQRVYCLEEEVHYRVQWQRASGTMENKRKGIGRTSRSMNRQPLSFSLRSPMIAGL